MKIASFYSDLAFNVERPEVAVLLETQFTKEIRIAMKRNQQMKEYQTPFPIVLELVEGNVDFGSKGKVLNLVKGGLVALEGNIPHDLKAIDDSILRLTLTKSDETNRVQNVVNC